MQINKDTVMNGIGSHPNNGNTIVSGSCDCLIGFISGEKVNKMNIDYEVERIVATQINFKKYNLLKGKLLSPKEITDNRRGYLSRFKFCPYCGEKINWKQVLSNCH